MDDKMKKISREIGIRMGIIMSFFLSLTGTMVSGHFSIPQFLLHLVVSTIISVLIAIIIPIGRIAAAACAALKLRRGSLPEKLLTTFIYDLLYTPLMTTIMIFIAYKMAMWQSHGMAQLNFVEMLIAPLIICVIMGFALIFVFQPAFMKQLLQKYDVQ